MYATRLYSAAGAGGGGGGVKSGRRGGFAVLEPPHPPTPHLPHPSAPPPPAYPLYQGRPDSHRGAYHYHPHPQPTHLVPPPIHPHYQHNTHFHTYGGGALATGGVAATGGKKKTWNFIHEKMSYDTFFTMKRLIERSRQPDEVLRWVTQNPAKISHNHYPVALQKIGQLLQATPPARLGEDADAESTRGADGRDWRQVLEHQDFQTLCSSIIKDCGKFDNFSIVNCLYAVAALGESHAASLNEWLHMASPFPLRSLSYVCILEGIS